MLNESELRKPGFSEGHKVTLADGQEWVLPRPTMRFTPKVSPDGTVDVDGGASFGPEFDSTLEILFGVTEVSGLEYLKSQFTMAVKLLSANYDLKPGDFATLLPWEPESETNQEMWRPISRALVGLVPKAGADGCD
jgi:hypothetical protein